MAPSSRENRMAKQSGYSCISNKIWLLSERRASDNIFYLIILQSVTKVEHLANMMCGGWSKDNVSVSTKFMFNSF